MIEEKSKQLDIVDGGLACLIFVVLNYLFYLMLYSLPAGALQNNAIYTLLSVLLEALFFVASVITLKLRGKSLITSINLNKKVRGNQIGWSFLISVICLILFTSLTNAFMASLENWGYTSVLSDTSITSFGEVLLSTITVCAIPAFCEEIMFRGVVLNSLKDLGKWPAIIISAFCFMIMHGNPDQTVHQFILGLVLGYVCITTGNLWISMLIHFFNNFIAIVLSYALSLYSAGVAANTAADVAEVVDATATYSWGEIAGTFVYGLITAALGGYLVYLIVKKINAKSNKQNLAQTSNEQTEQTAQEVGVAEIASTETQADDNQVASSQPNSDIIAQPTGKAKKYNGWQIAITCLGYTVFFVYFIREWILYLLAGLGL